MKILRQKFYSSNDDSDVAPYLVGTGLGAGVGAAAGIGYKKATRENILKDLGYGKESKNLFINDTISDKNQLDLLKKEGVDPTKFKDYNYLTEEEKTKVRKSLEESRDKVKKSSGYKRYKELLDKAGSRTESESKELKKIESYYDSIRNPELYGTRSDMYADNVAKVKKGLKYKYAPHIGAAGLAAAGLGAAYLYNKNK